VQAEHANIARAFSEMGLSFRTVFPDPIDRLEHYRNHRWTVIKTKTHHLVHAVPPASEFEQSFWEKWFSVKGGPVIHHILFASVPPVPYHDIYDAPSHPDALQPPEVANRRWYVIDDPSMFAWGVKILLANR